MKVLVKAITPFILLSCATSKSIDVARDSTDFSSSEIYAFIGKKVSVEEFDPNVEDGYIVMDSAYRATYEIVEQYTGKALPRLVQFEAYDHYGFPPFAKHKNVLIYLKKYKGDLFHVKYRYDAVQHTMDYGWVTCGTSKGWNDKTVLTPVRINQGRGCREGNLAENIAKTRVSSKDVQ